MEVDIASNSSSRIRCIAVEMCLGFFSMCYLFLFELSIGLFGTVSWCLIAARGLLNVFHLKALNVSNKNGYNSSHVVL